MLALPLDLASRYATWLARHGVAVEQVKKRGSGMHIDLRQSSVEPAKVKTQA